MSRNGDMPAGLDFVALIVLGGAIACFMCTHQIEPLAAHIIRCQQAIVMHVRLSLINTPLVLYLSIHLRIYCSYIL